MLRSVLDIKSTLTRIMVATQTGGDHESELDCLLARPGEPRGAQTALVRARRPRGGRGGRDRSRPPARLSSRRGCGGRAAPAGGAGARVLRVRRLVRDRDLRTDPARRQRKQRRGSGGGAGDVRPTSPVLPACGYFPPLEASRKIA